jgi:hypothetical protein
MTTISGRVLDWATVEPLPGATVSLMAGNLTLRSIAADREGLFTLSTTAVPDSMKIESVGYTTRIFGFAEYESFWTFFLQPAYKEGETATVYSTLKKSSWLPVAMFALLLLMAKKKKRN